MYGSGFQFGNILTNYTCATICEHLGWEWIHYIFGSAGVAWSVAWMLLIADSPETQCLMPKKEREYIVDSLAGETDTVCAVILGTLVFRNALAWTAGHALEADAAIATCLGVVRRSVLHGLRALLLLRRRAHVPRKGRRGRDSAGTHSTAADQRQLFPRSVSL